MASWSFLTNHARVLLHIAHDPGARLRDIAQLKSPEDSATLRGTTISAQALVRRFGSVRRVWVVQMGNLGYTVTDLGRVEHQLLSRMRLAASWHIRSVLLSLYVR